VNRICTRPPPNYLISKNSLPHPAFQTASQQDGALIVAPDSFFLAERARIAPLSKCLRESKVAPSASGRLNKSNKLLHLRARRMKNEHQGALLSSKKSSKSLSKSVTPCLKDSNEAREPWARPALASVPEPPPITRPSANSVGSAPGCPSGADILATHVRFAPKAAFRNGRTVRLRPIVIVLGH
jgi:hypothetical protein